MEMLGQLKVTDGANCAPPMRFERCFVEVRRRTRPMVLFVNMAAWEKNHRCTIFHRFNQQWQNRALSLFTQAA